MARTAPNVVVQESAASRGRELLETHLPLIRKKLAALGRRGGLPSQDVEELVSWALVKLVEEDFRILSRWQGRSSLPTYLNVVLANLVRDYRTHLWGKWRPSAAARRQGKEVELLERLWGRDGLPLDEAIRRLREEHGVAASATELERLVAGLQRRPERLRVGEEALRRVAVDGRVEARVEERERAGAADRVSGTLAALLRSLPAEDRLLLKLYYKDGQSMAAISARLRQPQRRLYAWRDRCLLQLRRALESAGLGAEGVRPLLGAPGGLELEGEGWE